jgi:hypothetical protein
VNDSLAIILFICGLFGVGAIVLLIGERIDRLLPGRIKGSGWLILVTVPFVVGAAILGLTSDRWPKFGWLIYSLCALLIVGISVLYVYATSTDLLPAVLSSMWRRLSPKVKGGTDA